MTALFFAFCVVACSFSLVLSSCGKAAVWTLETSETKSKPSYNTQHTDVSSVSSFAKKYSSGAEVLLFLQHGDGTSSLSDSNIVESIKRSSRSNIFSTVYNEKSTDSDVKDAKTLSVEDFQNLLADKSSPNSPLKNGKLDTFIIPLSDGTSSASLLTMVSLSDSPIVLMVFDGLLSSSKNEVSIPSKHAHYSRILTDTSSTSSSTTSSTSTTSTSSIYYKPEGAEYSIYYANTYLYITPDIFTGIMTGLFMFFVLLVGYSCLSAIQGPSTFSSIVPPVGKEA